MEAKSVEHENNFKRIDSHQQAQNDMENSSQKENLSSAHAPNCGEFEPDHGANGRTNQEIHHVRSTLGRCPQPNECVPDELISHDLHSTSNCDQCQELKHLPRETDVFKSDPTISVASTKHEDSTNHGILKNDMATNHVPTVEDSQLAVSVDKTLFHDGSSDSKHLNNFATTVSSSGTSLFSSYTDAEMSILDKKDSLSTSATKEKLAIDSLLPDTSRISQLNASTCNSYLDEIEISKAEDVQSPGDCGNTTSANLPVCTEENTIPKVVDHNMHTDLNSEESIFEKSLLASRSFKESGQDGHVIKDESCSLREDSDPNFFKELIGTEDGGDFVELYGENNFSYSPAHTSGGTESSGSASDPILVNSDIDLSTGRVQDDFSHTVASPASNMGYSYNPYLWTPTEIECASGSTECSLVEHSLKLRSAYADVEVIVLLFHYPKLILI